MRHRWLGVSVLCLMLSAAVAGLANAAERAPVAIVTTIAGNASVQRGASGLPVKIEAACPLYVGDRVLVGAGSKARIVFADRPPQMLGPTETLVIGASPAATRSTGSGGALQRVWQAILSRYESAFVRERTARPATTRGDDDETVPHPVYPRNTAILEAAPKLAWTAVPGADQYVVTIAFYGTYEKVRQIRSSKTSATYPQDGPPLQPGRRYFWCVERAGADADLSEGAWFAVLDQEGSEQYETTRQALEELYPEGSAERAEAVALLAAQYELNDLAVENLRLALEKQPQAAALRWIMADLLARMERPKDAEKMVEGLPDIAAEERAEWRDVIIEPPAPEGQP